MSFAIKRQRDAMDCGPSCLAMIAKHYGQQADKEQLRKICSLGKEGVSLLGISKADCHRDTGLDPKTIRKWWNSQSAD